MLAWYSKLTQVCSAVSIVFLVMLTSITCAQGLTPQESLSRMQVPGGLRADLVACEPLIRQPVAIDWDDRGRLWVMQYLQYPNPEGLVRQEVDRYSRTTYDMIPKAPPHGPRGSDRLTILSDTDADGKMDQAQDFVDGLNLASGFAFGHGGVFVMNVPYLLFYPDQDRDDRPDSDPQVLLEGFGMQDAHSVANSLCFGPDGWLYGCQGSTVTANIRGIEFQQGIWRYHPKSKAFELFCEGGGNSWGLDFDASGELLYSTNYGGFVLVHGVQGAYYVKSFAKHGELHNPYTFGYFQHAPHENFTGGHVTVGGIVYQADRLGPEFRGKYLAADLLGHGAHWHHLKSNGSTLTTAHGGSILQSKDPWFAPSDLTCGPDGAIYIADWHDARMAHPDPDAQWDRSNGRVYRITSVDAPSSIDNIDLSKMDDQAVLDRLNSSDQWHVRRARQELVRRYANMQTPDIDPPEALIESLRQITFTSPDSQKALEAFWTWTSLASLTDAQMGQLLASPHASIRRWCIRWIGDQEVLGRTPVSSQLAHQLDELAENEQDIHVRQQLACTAARLAPSIAMPIINANINRSIDLQDPYIPL
jgi:putative membrane-bound dehydrogenase-like protein